MDPRDTEIQELRRQVELLTRSCSKWNAGYHDDVSFDVEEDEFIDPFGSRFPVTQPLIMERAVCDNAEKS